MPLPSSDSLSSFGGPKSDFLGIAAIDPTTDISAADHNAMAATVAMGSRMVPRCELRFTGIAGTPVVSAFEAVWKGATPTAPTPARTGVGVFTFTWPASVDDEIGGTHSVQLTSGWGFAEGATPYHVQVTPAANVLTVHVFTMAGAASDAVGAVIRVGAR